MCSIWLIYVSLLFGDSIINSHDYHEAPNLPLHAISPQGLQGTVYVHFKHNEPHSMYKELAIQTSLGPILEAIAEDYSPIESRFISILTCNVLFADIYFQKGIHMSMFRLPRAGL